MNGLQVLALLVGVLLTCQAAGTSVPDHPPYSWCNNSTQLSDRLVAEIRGYGPVVAAIIERVMQGPEQNQTYEELANFVDRFGARMAGSRNLENAIDYVVALLERRGLDAVYTEEAEVPHWVRGNESAWLLKPRLQRLNILGLGGSVGTPPEGIMAPVLVVKSFDELRAKAHQARGKIVVFNEDYTSYPSTVAYREDGASAARQAGAVAALVRSVTPFSIGSPHTGWMTYGENNAARIPSACITVEDAEFLERLQQRGVEMKIQLVMDAKNLPHTTSRNTVAELRGSTVPDEVVLVSGHLDSWDVGQGAMDDGGGAFIAWRALAVLRSLGLRPRRTLRCVLWTGEEEGIWGGRAYYKRHQREAPNMNVVMESDMGTFRPLGLMLASANPTARCMAEHVLGLMGALNATRLRLGDDGPDTKQWVERGVPGATLDTANEKYFYFHHTDGDTMTVEDPVNLDLCTAFWAAVAFVFADLSERLPR
uniref:Carboxypeptidase Q n=1 Tax=Ixodes ricinus TaxID=34613 RepID=A0A6B0VBK3_IXORI